MDGLRIPYGPGVVCNLPGNQGVVVSLSESIRGKLVGIERNAGLSAGVARDYLREEKKTASLLSIMSKPVVILAAAAIPLVVGGAVFAAGVATYSVIGALFLQIIGALILGIGGALALLGIKGGLSGELSKFSEAQEEKARLAAETLRGLHGVDNETVHLETKQESQARPPIAAEQQLTVSGMPQ